MVAGCRPQAGQQVVTIDNGRIALGFDRRTGALLSFRDLNHKHEFLDKNIPGKQMWEIIFQGNPRKTAITANAAEKFKIISLSPLSLGLIWNDFPGNRDLKVNVSIRLDEKQPLSYWKISVSGTAGKKMRKVIFPEMAGIRDPGDEYLAVPSWMGQIMESPREYLSTIKNRAQKFEWVYPGPLSMQCIALYNSEKNGLYFSCNDTLNDRKSFSLTLDTLNTLLYQVGNYPAFDSALNTYAPSYEAVIGSFRGDWITAAGQYRDWAERQSWCRESRFKKGLTPTWLRETALWVWNRGRSGNVLTPASDLKQRLKLPVNVFWHWWHGCAYDDGFPEYLPPREGKASFIRAMDRAHKQGIHAIVYMNALQWGTSTQSWERENAAYYAVKDINGQLRSHVYNIFTGNALANMCVSTKFWRDKYASLADEAINSYFVDGIYMDQACLNRMCYDRNHGHPAGGGNYWVSTFGELTRQIRSGTPAGDTIVLAGEGGGESWIPFLDAFLTLQVSRERYAGTGSWKTIPFFQAVYHQYAVTYGNYSSLLVPPYDELWPKEFAPKDPLKLLNEDFNKQFLMEQARSFVWGMQPAIANYQTFLASERKEEIEYLTRLAKVRYKGLKYLLYGKFMRTPKAEFPEEDLKISRLSIYAGKKKGSVTVFHKRFPVVYAGTWKSDDGGIGIALAGISDDPYTIHFSLKAGDYGLPNEGFVYIIDINGRRKIGEYKKGSVQISYSLPPEGICIIEITG